MFEYLMPLLLMRTYPGTLLDQRCRMAVRAPDAATRALGVPWGISESAYDLVDRAGNYQYKAFGVPGLGLKRGLADELVVAPYATALAALVDPAPRPRNLRRSAEGAPARYGLLRGDRLHAAPIGTAIRRAGAAAAARLVVRAYLAHHQGMSLVAIANMLRRPRSSTASTPIRASRRPSCCSRSACRAGCRSSSRGPPRRRASLPPPAPLSTRRFRSPHTALPARPFPLERRLHRDRHQRRRRRQLCRGRAVTRLREDATRDPGSQFIYLRDVRRGAVWSATYQPTRREADDYLVEFFPEKAVFHRTRPRHRDAARGRGLARGRRRGPPALAHQPRRPRRARSRSRATSRSCSGSPARTSPIRRSESCSSRPSTCRSHALLCRRRPRALGRPRADALHVLASRAGCAARWSGRPTATRFLGRGRGPDDPVALDGRPLSGRPARCSIRSSACATACGWRPGGFARLHLHDRRRAERATAARALAQKYHDSGSGRARLRARLHARADLAAPPRDLARRGPALRAAGVARLLRRPSLRAAPEVRGAQRARPAGAVASRHLGRPADRAGARGGAPTTSPLVRQVLQAQEYWRLKGLSADVVILNEHAESYRDEMHEQLEALLESGPWAAWKGPARRRASCCAATACARRSGSCSRRGAGGAERRARRARQPARSAGSPSRCRPAERRDARAPRPRRSPRSPPRRGAAAALRQRPRRLRRGRPRVRDRARGRRETPLPWVNVLANPGFGTIVTASGAAFTWSENSRENRLTPFANDPVSRSRPREALYLRDEETGECWGATPGRLPRRRDSPRWIVRHAAGVTPLPARARTGSSTSSRSSSPPTSP